MWSNSPNLERRDTSSLFSVSLSSKRPISFTSGVSKAERDSCKLPLKTIEEVKDEDKAMMIQQRPSRHYNDGEERHGPTFTVFVKEAQQASWDKSRGGAVVNAAVSKVGVEGPSGACAVLLEGGKVK